VDSFSFGLSLVDDWFSAEADASAVESVVGVIKE
jgi:hypothetical protein